MIEDCNKFLYTMKDLESYLIEFEKDRSIKTKKFPDNCTIKGDKYCLVIVITYNECIFFANNEI